MLTIPGCMWAMIRTRLLTMNRNLLFYSMFSQFRPEDLKVHLDGRELTVEGKQEHKGEGGFIHRSFIRKWMLPENVDIESARTQLNDKDTCTLKPQRQIGKDQEKTFQSWLHRRRIRSSSIKLLT